MAIVYSQPGPALSTTSLPDLVHLLFISYCLDTFGAFVLLQTILYPGAIAILLFTLAPISTTPYLEDFLSDFVPATLRACPSWARRIIRAHLIRKARRILAQCLRIKRGILTFGPSLRIELAGLLRAVADYLSPPPDHDVSAKAEYCRLKSNLQICIEIIAARDSTIMALNRLLEGAKGTVRDMEADWEEERRTTKASKRDTKIEHLSQVMLLETQAIIDKGNHVSEVERKDRKLQLRRERLDAATALLSDQQSQLLEQKLQLDRQASRLRAQEAQIQQQEGFLEQSREMNDDLETKASELVSCQNQVEYLTTKVATLETLEAANSSLTTQLMVMEMTNITKSRRADAMTQLAKKRGVAIEAAQLELNAKAKEIRMLETSVRSKLRVNSLLSGKYQALLAATVRTSAIFKAEFASHDVQIASLKTDLKATVDRCHVLDKALDMAIAGEYEARCLVEALDHALRQRALAERRVLRRFGIGMSSDAEEVEESVELVGDAASDEEPHWAEDDAEAVDDAGEAKDCAVISAEDVVLQESSECEAPVVETMDNEIEVPAAVPVDVTVEEEVACAVPAVPESEHLSPQSSSLDISQVIAPIIEHAGDPSGLSDPDEFEAPESVRDSPRARVLYTPLWTRRPLGIRRPEWIDMRLACDEQEVQELTMSSPGAEYLELSVPIGQEEVIPDARTVATTAAVMEVEVDAEVIPIINDSGTDEWTPLDSSDSTAQETMSDPPRARVFHTSLRSRRPLDMPSPEWDDQWWYGGRFSEPTQTYPRGILNLHGGQRMLGVTWFKEEHLYFARDSKPKVVIHSTSEDHHIAQP